MSIGFDAHGCPGCGNDPNHKIRRYRNGTTENVPCEECGGMGKVSWYDCDRIICELEIDDIADNYEL